MDEEPVTISDYSLMSPGDSSSEASSPSLTKIGHLPSFTDNPQEPGSDEPDQVPPVAVQVEDHEEDKEEAKGEQSGFSLTSSEAEEEEKEDD